MKKHVTSFIARWRRRRAKKHISAWDVPVFDPDTGDLTNTRDTLKSMLWNDHVRKERYLP